MHQPTLRFPQFSSQIWIQAVGRSLYLCGYGLIEFCSPIIFVNYVGLSATTVGIGTSTYALAALVSNFLGGPLADFAKVGRKGTLLLAALLAILASGIFALTHNLLTLIVANLLYGLSTGFYWTAVGAAATDLTTSEERHNAFAMLGLVESAGEGIGVLAGGVLINQTRGDLSIFLIAGLVFLFFLVLVWIAITKTQQEQDNPDNLPIMTGWVTAFRDKPLRIFVLVNVLFTIYVALVSVTMPLYLTNFISEESVASLFSWWYIGLGAILQPPLAYFLILFMNASRALMVSMLIWGLGFLGIWLFTGVTTAYTSLIILSLAVLAIANAIYKPFAATFIAELAPKSLRGVYTALGSQCWAIGYFVGPLLGGWALDQVQNVTHDLWISVAVSTIFGIIILQFLHQNIAPPATALLTDMEEKSPTVL
ncbi:MFS transporter [Nostoc sphaeroides]|uniref:Major facilitator superfamily n=1 Tax=Nostoc sphaeroides CCNUC1 TaxID=2653204 RepID=A0A5P8WI69_9NOSO|nr:MFS transporter [Nostoc sphaeroides]QFS52515.1 major facilitator superfamily [Nostoc sphaeroides CCNUC1]